MNLPDRRDSFGTVGDPQRGTLSHLFQQCVSAVEGSVIALAFCATVGSKRRLMDEHHYHHGHGGPDQSHAGSAHTQLTGQQEAYSPMQDSLYLHGHGHGGGFDPRRGYHFRGEGADQHDKASRTSPIEGVPTRHIAHCLIATCVILFVVAAAVIVYFIFRAQEITFDCDKDFEEWRTGWSTEKQVWCCKHTQLTCLPADNKVKTKAKVTAHSAVVRTFVMPVVASTTTTTRTTSTTTKDPYNCKAPSTPSWSPEHIAWCCLHKDVSCPRTTTPVPFDCWAAFEDWARAWSEAKQEWCCRHQRVACLSLADLSPPPSSMHSPEDEWDCRGNLAGDYVGWSVARKAWCCEHRDTACPQVPHLSTTRAAVLSFPASPLASPLAPHP